jgi:Domain of unknown function (DUF4350)
MSGEAVFSGRLLAGWIAGAVVVFAISLYLMGGGEVSGPESTGASTFSRSAVGHAGIADVLQRLGIAVVKSRYNSLEKLTPQSVLVIAEPRPGQQSEEAIRALLKADRILLVLPKWTGLPSEQSPGWIREARLRSTGEAAWALHLVAPRAQVVRDDGEVKWATNPLGPAPSLAAPTQLLRGGDLRPIVAADRGMLVGEISGRDRTIWVLSDPDLISNHGLARGANATLAIALIKRLRGADGSVVFDEAVHGYVAKPTSPLLLLFDFPFVVATAQGLIAVGLLLWATMARFGAPQPLPPPLSAGRGGLLQNMAKLIELNGHQQIMVRRYVQETVRDVARQLHAPRGLSGDALLAWLQRVGTARAVEIDCRVLMDGADKLGAPQRRDSSLLVRLARDAHRWKGEILDGRSRHPRNH